MRTDDCASIVRAAAKLYADIDGEEVYVADSFVFEVWVNGQLLADFDSEAMARDVGKNFGGRPI